MTLMCRSRKSLMGEFDLSCQMLPRKFMGHGGESYKTHRTKPSPSVQLHVLQGHLNIMSTTLVLI